MDRLLKLLTNRTVLRAVAALVIAVAAAYGGIEITAPSAPPAPSTPASTPRTLATPDPTSPVPLTPLEGHEHEDLSGGAVEDTRLPRTAAPSGIKGCRTDINSHNFSQRPTGARARFIVGHWTASRNVPGWTDVDANVSWLDRPTTRASANFIIDNEGNCAYTVPITAMAWTQASGNPYSVSIEFVATGAEKGLTAAAAAKGGLVAGQVARKFGIPIRRTSATGCAAGAAGFRDHKSFGQCGGGHPDLGSWSLTAWINAAKAGGITATDRVTCRKLNWWRQHGRPHGLPEQRAVRRREALASRGVRCVASGPVAVG